jgi:hypothetical protein
MSAANDVLVGGNLAQHGRVSRLLGSVAFTCWSALDDLRHLSSFLVEAPTWTLTQDKTLHPRLKAFCVSNAMLGMLLAANRIVQRLTAILDATLASSN